jgi:hypothetical protein
MRDVDSRDVEVVKRFSAITYQNNKIDGSHGKDIGPYIIVV